MLVKQMIWSRQERESKKLMNAFIVNKKQANIRNFTNVGVQVSVWETITFGVFSPKKQRTADLSILVTALIFILIQLIIITINFGMFGKIQVGNTSRTNHKKEEQQQPKDTVLPKTKPINKDRNRGKKEQVNKPSLEDQLKGMMKRYVGSKFRVLNELLYTSSSGKAVEYFREHEEDFELYHEGFRHQATKWTKNPLHSLIAYLKGKEGIENKVVLDLGCGDGLLQQKLASVASKVRSFDLVAKKDFIEVADISKLPVADRSADACVFCLSLMGTNYIEFLKEARRVLKANNSELLISQVESRCKEWGKFVLMVESLGFSCFQNKTNSYFRMLYFKSDLTKKGPLTIDRKQVNLEQFSKQILTSCLYKRR